MKIKEKRVRIISLNDVHIPYHAPEAVDLAIRFCGSLQPDIIILHEWHDFYDLSHFDKDPNRINHLQAEIDQVTQYFWALRKVCPRARIILLNSNHLDRLRKYLWRQAQALASLRSLEIENLLCLSEYNIEFMETFEYEGVLFKHGDVIRKFSGYTAKGEFEKEGMSGVSGHTHRLSCYYHTNRGGNYVWAEAGCLCDLKPEYINGTANWMNGFVLATFENNHYYIEAIPIIANKIIWGNETYK